MILQIKTSFGFVEIEHDGEVITKARILTDISDFKKASKLDDFSKIIQQQIEAYFAGELTDFSLPLQTTGTEKKIRVLEFLKSIPYGKTVTYGEVAKACHSSARAIGQACKKNPIALIIPCHRVVAQNGLGGYCGKTAGEYLSAKEWLLTFERKRLI